MLTETRLKNILAYLKQYKVNAISTKQTNVLQKSYEWYRGNVADFHMYTEQVGKSKREYERLTYNLPKRLCEDLASYLWNEKSTVTFDNSEINEKLQKVLVDNNFELMFTEFLEKYNAYGGGAIVTSIRDGKIAIDFIDAQNLLITSFTNNRVNGIVVMDEFIVDNVTYLHLVEHLYEDKKYTIKQMLMESSNDQVNKSTRFDIILSEEELATYSVDVESGALVKSVETPMPFFQYFKTNITNNYDNKSPYGLSRLANLFDDFKQVDLNYDMIFRENLNGESTLFFDSTIASEQVYNEDGTMKYVQTFDYNNPNYKMVNRDKGLTDSGSPMFVYAPQLRNDTLHNSLTKLINATAFKFGLGNQYYENKTTASTATEIIHSNSKLWRTITKEQNGIIQPLKKIISAIISNIALSETTKILEVDVDLVNVKFDDSIIIDDESLKDRALRLIELDILPKWKYLVDFENYTEEEAKALVSEAEAIVDYTDEEDEINEES